MLEISHTHTHTLPAAGWSKWYGAYLWTDGFSVCVDERRAQPVSLRERYIYSEFRMVKMDSDLIC